MKEYDHILFKLENQVATLTINNPKSLNALNQATLEEIEEAVSSIQDGSVAASFLIITGSGEKAFVAGADIKEMAEKTAMEAREFSRLGNRVFMLIDQLTIPTLAAINGYALGGGLELAMACDLRFASTNAVAGLPEVSLGVIPGFGGTQRLTRLLGLSKAVELMISAENVKAEEGHRLGLFNRIYSSEELLSQAEDFAQKVVSKGPIAVKFAKQAAKNGNEMPLKQAVEMESELFGLAFSTEDQTEGMNAFIEKRSPDFKNK